MPLLGQHTNAFDISAKVAEHQAQWAAMGDAYRQWRLSGDTSELLEMIVVEFRARGISEQCAFVDMSAQWREY
jgi:hypothetical protein